MKNEEILEEIKTYDCWGNGNYMEYIVIQALNKKDEEINILKRISKEDEIILVEQLKEKDKIIKQLTTQIAKEVNNKIKQKLGLK